MSTLRETISTSHLEKGQGENFTLIDLLVFVIKVKNQTLLSPNLRLNLIRLHICVKLLGLQIILTASDCIESRWPYDRNSVHRATYDLLRRQFYIAHGPTQYRFAPLPQLKTPNIKVLPEWSKIRSVWYQWEALNAKRFVTGDDGR